MRSQPVVVLVICLVCSVCVWSELPVQGQASSLIENGSFESGDLGLWDVCGDVRLVDTQAGADALAVHSGRYALRLGSPTDGSCGQTLNDQAQAYYNAIDVPSDASALTLDFWYSRTGDFGSGLPNWALNVLLVSIDDGPQVRISDPIYPDVTEGWNQARYILTADEVAQARGRRFSLSFTITFLLTDQVNLAYYIDDIRFLTTPLRTPTETTPPDALRADTSRALVGYGQVGNEVKTIRSNLNGSDPVKIYDGALNNGGLDAKWSKNGMQVAVWDDLLQEEPNEPISTNSAQISVLSVMQPDGSGRREVYRTPGKKLVPGLPPGCRSPRTDCQRYDDPAIDSLIHSYDWSPDSQRIALNVCTTSRYADGFTTDAICDIRILDLASGNAQVVIEHAQDVSWSRDNRLLYRVNIDGSLYNIPKGIYEADLNTSPVQPRLLFAHRSQTYQLEDMQPTWAPDGRHFVTLRFVQGLHYDQQGNREYNSVLMLFDRENPANPRQLVLVDYGRSVGSPAWSPDSAYILYNLEIASNSFQTWWLETATGRTGLLADNIIDVSWRPIIDARFRVYLPWIGR